MFLEDPDRVVGAGPKRSRGKSGSRVTYIGRMVIVRILESSAFLVVSTIGIAIFGPLLARFGVSPLFLSDDYFWNAIVGGSCAIFLGVYVYKNVAVFPGGAKIQYVFTSLSLAFLCVTAVLLSFRMSYSLYVLGGGFVISVVWLSLCDLLRQTIAVRRLVLVPGGGTDRLTALSGADWLELRDPTIEDIQCDALVADLRSGMAPEWERLLTDAVLAGIPVFHYKQIYEGFTGRVEIEHLSENDLGSLVPSTAYSGLKRIFDMALALPLSVLLCPLFASLALLIKMDSPGPAIFTQKRVGFGGKEFVIFKFRTMKVAAVEEDVDKRDQAMTRDGDPRITKLGKFLRRTRLDELPQIVNILKGEMSWIGPRPEAVSLSSWYRKELPFYMYRHIVRPGITGWAQVNQGHVVDADDVLEKLHYDFFYIRYFSFWLDVLIFVRTVRIVLSGFGAK